MKKKFTDPNVSYKSKTVENKIQLYYHNKNLLPLPTEIEISESGTCNRKCSFCPRSDPEFIDKKIFISNDLHLKLCEELNSLNYQGTIRFSGFVEPMLDKNIYNLIKMCRDFMPKCNVEMVTNGDPLNLNRLTKLFENGLNRVLISVYDGKEDADKFEKMCTESNLEKSQFMIRHRYLPQDQNFGIALSNRGGKMSNAEFKINPLQKALKNACYIPSYTFFLDYQGDVLICPHDWGKKIILGNLNKDKLIDIWFSEKALTLRKMLNNSNRNFSPCNICDVEGTLMGKKNSSYFS